MPDLSVAIVLWSAAAVAFALAIAWLRDARTMRSHQAEEALKGARPHLAVVASVLATVAGLALFAISFDTSDYGILLLLTAPIAGALLAAAIALKIAARPTTKHSTESRILQALCWIAVFGISACYAVFAGLG